MDSSPTTSKLVRASATNLNEITIPIPVQFSPGGRYLKYRWDNEDYVHVLDTVTNFEIDNGKISPEDHYLIRPWNTGDTAFHLCKLPTQGRLCNDGSYSLSETDIVRQVEWISPSRLVVVICADEGLDTCRLKSLFISDEYNRIISYRLPDNLSDDASYAFAYKPDDRSFAVINNGTTITVGRHQFDLAEYLDGEITHIEWMTSLFYREANQ